MALRTAVSDHDLGYFVDKEYSKEKSAAGLSANSCYLKFKACVIFAGSYLQLMHAFKSELGESTCPQLISHLRNKEHFTLYSSVEVPKHTNAP